MRILESYKKIFLFFSAILTIQGANWRQVRMISIYLCGHLAATNSRSSSIFHLVIHVIIISFLPWILVIIHYFTFSANVFQSKFLPLTGDTHIVTSSRDGQVRLAQLSETGTCHRTKKLAQHKRASHKLALLRDRPHEFISGGEDGLIFEIDVRADKPTKLLLQKENERSVGIFSVHANPIADHLIISAGSDQYVRLFDRRYPLHFTL